MKPSDSSHLGALEVDYRASGGWALPILGALKENPETATYRERWADSYVSDLAMSVETRLACLREQRLELNRLLASLADAFPSDRQLQKYIGPITRAYTFKAAHRPVVYRLLIAMGGFVSEARSLFENVAECCARVRHECLGRPLGREARWYSDLAARFRDAGQARALRVLRHEIRHGRAPWLRFLVASGHPTTFEPQLVFDWRPTASEPKDFASLTEIAQMWSALSDATDSVRYELAGEIREHRSSRR